jgi:TonB family protein
MMPGILNALATFTFGLCIVLVLRRGLRRYIGAVSAYRLWILPPVTLLATVMPHWDPVHTARLPMTYAVAGMVHAASATMAHTDGLSTALMLIWLGGASYALLRLLSRHRQLHRRMQPLPVTMRDALDGALPTSLLSGARLHDAGPAVVWSGRTFLLLPTDFMARFTPEERQLILTHELTHIRHGDAWWNLLAELATVVFWFHPMVWFARSRMRLDQELACDDDVLRRFPRATRAYAQTLFHGTGHAGTPVLATWLEEPQLKERLTMIRNLTTHKPWRRMGVPVLAALLVGGALSAQAMGTQASGEAHAPSAKLSFKNRVPPVYPAYALKHHLVGTVMVKVKVSPDGRVLAVKAMPGKADASLVKSALDAAAKWRYNPATDAKGKPVTAWAKVPIRFAMDKPAVKK